MRLKLWMAEAAKSQAKRLLLSFNRVGMFGGVINHSPKMLFNIPCLGMIPNKRVKMSSKWVKMALIVVVGLLLAACNFGDPKEWVKIYGSCSQFNSCPQSNGINDVGGLIAFLVATMLVSFAFSIYQWIKTRKIERALNLVRFGTKHNPFKVLIVLIVTGLMLASVNVVMAGDKTPPTPKPTIDTGNNGNNGNNGKNQSDPNGNGKNDQGSTDGNNGCGNSKSTGDDNNGNGCGKSKVTSTPKPPTVTPKPTKTPIPTVTIRPPVITKTPVVIVPPVKINPPTIKTGYCPLFFTVNGTFTGTLSNGQVITYTGVFTVATK